MRLVTPARDSSYWTQTHEESKSRDDGEGLICAWKRGFMPIRGEEAHSWKRYFSGKLSRTTHESLIKIRQTTRSLCGW